MSLHWLSVLGITTGSKLHHSSVRNLDTAWFLSKLLWAEKCVQKKTAVENTVNASKLIKCLHSCNGGKFYTQFQPRLKKALVSVTPHVGFSRLRNTALTAVDGTVLSKCLLLAALLIGSLRSGCTSEIENSPQTPGTQTRPGVLGQTHSSNGSWLNAPTGRGSSWGGASITTFHEVLGHPLPPVEQRSFTATMQLSRQGVVQQLPQKRWENSLLAILSQKECTVQKTGPKTWLFTYRSLLEMQWTNSRKKLDLLPS